MSNTGFVFTCEMHVGQYSSDSLTAGTRDIARTFNSKFHSQLHWRGRFDKPRIWGYFCSPLLFLLSRER